MTVSEAVAKLRGGDAITRLHAAQALRWGGSAAMAAVPDLSRATKDADSDVRFTAVAALGEMGALAALPALCVALKDDEDRIIRAQAAATLGDLVVRALSGVPALTAALQDDARSVAQSAADALRVIKLALEEAGMC